MRLILNIFADIIWCSSTSAPDLSAAAVFGFGCNLSQHLKYGMCLDGKCGRRGNWEEVMLLSNDETRLTGTKVALQ